MLVIVKGGNYCFHYIIVVIIGTDCTKRRFTIGQYLVGLSHQVVMGDEIIAGLTRFIGNDARQIHGGDP